MKNLEGAKWTLVVIAIQWGFCHAGVEHRFQAYKCDGDALQGAQFYRHEDCNVNRGHVTESEYFIVQKNNKHNITGGRCSIKETVRTGEKIEILVQVFIKMFRLLWAL